jgi:hypothetical protein
MNTRHLFSVALLSLALAAPPGAMASTNRTAFALVRQANKLVAASTQDKVVEIHSDKSTGQLAPDTWYVTYYDSTAPLKATEVKFINGRESKVSRPNHWRSWFSGTRPLDWSKVKIDSDRALAIALAQPDVKNLDLQASQFWLERTSSGSTWRIRLWPAWPAATTDVLISTKNGLVLKTENHRRGKD